MNQHCRDTADPIAPEFLTYFILSVISEDQEDIATGSNKTPKNSHIHRQEYLTRCANGGKIIWGG